MKVHHLTWIWILTMLLLGVFLMVRSLPPAASVWGKGPTNTMIVGGSNNDDEQ